MSEAILIVIIGAKEQDIFLVDESTLVHVNKFSLELDLLGHNRGRGGRSAMRFARLKTNIANKARNMIQDQVDLIMEKAPTIMKAYYGSCSILFNIFEDSIPIVYPGKAGALEIIRNVLIKEVPSINILNECAYLQLFYQLIEVDSDQLVLGLDDSAQAILSGTVKVLLVSNNYAMDKIYNGILVGEWINVQSEAMGFKVVITTNRLSASLMFGLEFEMACILTDEYPSGLINLSESIESLEMTLNHKNDWDLTPTIRDITNLFIILDPVGNIPSYSDALTLDEPFTYNLKGHKRSISHYEYINLIFNIRPNTKVSIRSSGSHYVKKIEYQIYEDYYILQDNDNGLMLIDTDLNQESLPDISSPTIVDFTEQIAGNLPAMFKKCLIVAPQLSATFLHSEPHNTWSLLGLLRGSKLWILFPPGTLSEDKKNSPEFTDLHPLRWVHENYQADGSVRYLFQKRGTVIYVPPLWDHMVINLTDTISVAKNGISYSNFEQVGNELNEENFGEDAKEFVNRLRNIMEL
eukprot:TRINITY_DN2715_c0_g1_i1.p1 TRINITY_DN2715_c0_g1~~TRINITY_DN2715_c0_g1_i1.p1  ORF type:complete len:595 (-),score=94.69 TRINITY_DN2715_c0_g1_i1:27-1592(-)